MELRWAINTLPPPNLTASPPLTAEARTAAGVRTVTGTTHPATQLILSSVHRWVCTQKEGILQGILNTHS